MKINVTCGNVMKDLMGNHNAAGNIGIGAGWGTGVIGDPPYHIGDFPPHPWDTAPLEPYIIPQRPYDWFPYDPNIWTKVFTTTQITPASATFRVDTSKGDLRLSLDVPGIKKETIDVMMNNGNLTVTGKRADTGVCTYQNYSVSSEYDTDPEHIDARVEDGVLTVTFTKLKKPSSKVKVK